MGRERDGKRVKSRHAPVRPRTLRGGSELEHTGSDRRTRRGVVNSAQATEREWTSEDKAWCITSAKFPVHCCNRGSAEKMSTPATECEVELLEGRIITDELETKRRAR